MTDVYAGDRHYMEFPYSTSGILAANWTTRLFRNGELTQDIAIEFREQPAGYYHFSFINDGGIDVNWTLIVNPTSDTDNLYGKDWRVISRVIEQTVKQVRVRLDSDGGFFGNPTE